MVVQNITNKPLWIGINLFFMMTLYAQTAGLSYITPNAFDLQQALSTGVSLNIGSQDIRAHGMVFSADGMKLYVSGTATDRIFEYTLTTAFSVSTATFNQSFSVSAQETVPTGVAFSKDGLRMFVVGRSSDAVNVYNLTTAFDIGMATYAMQFVVLAQVPNLTDIEFSSDGLVVFLTDFENDRIVAYQLSTPYDFSSGVSFLTNYSVSQGTNPHGVRFSPDGMRMFVCYSNSENIHQYALSTPYDLTTASFSSKTLSPSLSLTGMSFSNDGSVLMILDHLSDTIYEYDIENSFQYTENTSSNGSINNLNSSYIALHGDTFSVADGNSLTHGVDYTITNLPVGISPALTVFDNQTKARLVLNGHASANGLADGVGQLQFVFTDAAFATLSAASVSLSGTSSPHPSQAGIVFFDYMRHGRYFINGQANNYQFGITP